MHEILPGILDDSWEKIEEKILQSQAFTNRIHIDLVDESFADKKNFFDPAPFATYSNDIFFELHMMVKNPEQYLEAWSNAGIRRFIGHVEQMPDQISFVAKAQELGEVGLALDGDTSLDAIKVAHEDLDTILIMMRKAGVSGEEFEAGLLDKVRAMRLRSDFLPVEVDGGISDKTIQEAMSAGAKRFVSTSYLFWQGNDPQAKYEKLQSLIAS